MSYISDFFHLSCMGLLQYFLLTGLYYWICYFLFKKALHNAKIQQKEIRRQDVIREILHSTGSSCIMVLIIFLVVKSPLHGYTKIYENISDYSIYWLVGSFIIGLCIHDTYFYWMHRLLHHKKIFRYVHLIHHKSTNPSPFAAYLFICLKLLQKG